MSRTYRFNKDTGDFVKQKFKSFVKKHRKNTKAIKYDTQFIQINRNKRTVA